MTVDFYISKSDFRKVDKDLQFVTTLPNVYFKSDESKENPTIELAYNLQVVNCNYCYIRELHYYYYLAEPTFGKQRIFFQLSTDLLMTFKTDILNLDCIIARQEEEYNTYLKDENLPVKAYQDVNTIVFDTCFLNPEEEVEPIIMVVNGGA